MCCFWAAAGVSPSKRTVHLTSDFSVFMSVYLSFLQRFLHCSSWVNPIQVLAGFLGKSILSLTSAIKQEPQEERSPGPLSPALSSKELYSDIKVRHPPNIRSVIQPDQSPSFPKTEAAPSMQTFQHEN